LSLQGNVYNSSRTLTLTGTSKGNGSGRSKRCSGELTRVRGWFRDDSNYSNFELQYFEINRISHSLLIIYRANRPVFTKKRNTTWIIISAFRNYTTRSKKFYCFCFFRSDSPPTPSCCCCCCFRFFFCQKRESISY